MKIEELNSSHRNSRLSAVADKTRLLIGLNGTMKSSSSLAFGQQWFVRLLYRGVMASQPFRDVRVTSPANKVGGGQVQVEATYFNKLTQRPRQQTCIAHSFYMGELREAEQAAVSLRR